MQEKSFLHKKKIAISAEKWKHYQRIEGNSVKTENNFVCGEEMWIIKMVRTYHVEIRMIILYRNGDDVIEDLTWKNFFGAYIG